jgi:hypothetical protein
VSYELFLDDRGVFYNFLNFITSIVEMAPPRHATTLTTTRTRMVGTIMVEMRGTKHQKKKKKKPEGVDHLGHSTSGPSEDGH